MKRTSPWDIPLVWFLTEDDFARFQLDQACSCQYNSNDLPRVCQRTCFRLLIWVLAIDGGICMLAFSK